MTRPWGVLLVLLVLLSSIYCPSGLPNGRTKAPRALRQDTKHILGGGSWYTAANCSRLGTQEQPQAGAALVVYKDMFV